jgi:hypothetical protein
MNPFQKWSRAAAALVLSGSTFVAAQGLPAGLVEVKPVARGQAPGAASLQLRQGRFFSYVLPEGWKVGEDGQFALTLIAPDSKALTVMVGNAGMPLRSSAAQYAYEKLMVLRPENLRLGEPRTATPIAGFAGALEFEVQYAVNGVPCHGVATVHSAPAYDSTTLAMTAALSQATQWPGYAPWLPVVAQQVSASNGAAFGRRGVMAQNLQNSTAYAEAARQYRDWSQRNWQQVTDARNASTDRNATDFRAELGAVQTYVNPYDARTPLDLPTTYQYFWVNEHGTIAGTNDPSVNPNVGSTNDWRKLPRR